jgi:hypothetical protein
LILTIVYKLIPKESQIIPLLSLKPSANLIDKDNEVSPKSEKQMQLEQTTASTMENMLQILAMKRGEPHVQIIEMIL